MATDLDNFNPSPPQNRLDDKAATLEAELADRKAHFNKERFCYFFAITTLFNMLIASKFDGAVVGISVVSGLLFLIGIGKWLDFPFIHERLDSWERLCRECCWRYMRSRKWWGEKASDQIEP